MQSLLAVFQCETHAIESNSVFSIHNDDLHKSIEKIGLIRNVYAGQQPKPKKIEMLIA